MKKLLLTLTGAALLTGGAITSQARDHRDDWRRRDERHFRSRSVYVIERDRPVQRVVFVDERGRYFQETHGRRVYVTRYFNSYPERYFDRRGHRRVGISLHFD